MAGILTRRAYAFAPAATGDASFSSTKLLLGFEGADASTTVTDESAAARGNATMLSGAQIDTAQFKYGASSLLLNGSSDYITYPQSADFDFGAGQFTVELFVRHNAVASDIAYIGNRSGTAVGWRLVRNSGGLALQADNGAGTLGVFWTPSTGVWYHLCADRDGSGVTRVYVDGGFLQKGVGVGAIGNSTLGPAIGRLPSVALWFLNGWVDEVRVTKGVCRYGSDGGFTVPAAAYPRS